MSSHTHPLTLATSRNLSLGERNTLENALSVAAERFDENAATFQKSFDDWTAAGRPDVNAALYHPGAGEQLAEQFRQQARDTRALADLLQGDDDDADQPEIWVERVTE